MAKFFDSIPDDQQAFIRNQNMFFVASAPLDADGHVNLSPKGLDCFRIFSANKVAYLDLAGSGNETSAHLAENGRITLMFCSFDRAPLILRLYGTGRTVLPGSPEWEELIPHFDEMVGQRQIIVADIHKVQTSCGYAVPLYDFAGERQTLNKYWNAKDDDFFEEHLRTKNACSIDGLQTTIGESLDH